MTAVFLFILAFAVSAGVASVLTTESMLLGPALVALLLSPLAGVYVRRCSPQA